MDSGRVIASAQGPGDPVPRYEFVCQVHADTGRQLFLHELARRPEPPVAARLAERGFGDQLGVLGEMPHHRGDVGARPGALESERGQELPGLLLTV